jgi:PAS domain S-box-containing protein
MGALLIMAAVAPNGWNLLGAGVAFAITGGALVAHWRGYKSARQIVPLTLALLTGALAPEPFVTLVAPLTLLLPLVAAQTLGGPGWIFACAVLQLAILLIRAGGQGVYTQPVTLLLYWLCTAGLMLHRLSTDAAQRAALDRQRELERAAEAQHEAEQRFVHVFQANPIGIVLTRPEDGMFIEVNDAFLAITGYERDEVVGRTSEQLDLWPSAPRRIELVDQLLSGEPVRDIDLPTRRKDGSMLDLLVTIDAIELGTSRVLLTMLQDVTERRKLEAQLLQSQKLESVGRLAGGIAHDFNNVLAVINGYAELLYDSLPDAALQSDLDQIRQATSRATRLTRQLLAFARKQVMSQQPINLNDLILHLDRLLRPLLGSDIELVTLPGPNIGIVMADPGQIEQVVMNLAVNARDAMPGGGKLTIETAAVMRSEPPGGPHVLLRVSDTGVGMTHEVRAHAFEPFFTTKEQGKGTGLGLAMVYGIITQHGGKVTLWSEAGRGTSVQLYLPTANVAPIQEEPRDTSEPLGGRETVLVVEDEPAVRSVVSRALTGLGYTVLEASNGGDALELVQRFPRPIALLLTDLVMPQLGGFALAAQMAAQRPAIRVVFMSGYNDTASIRREDLGAGQAFLQKPFTRVDLARAVRAALDTPVAIAHGEER